MRCCGTTGSTRAGSGAGTADPTRCRWRRRRRHHADALIGRSLSPPVRRRCPAATHRRPRQLRWSVGHCRLRHESHRRSWAACGGERCPTAASPPAGTGAGPPTPTTATAGPYAAAVRRSLVASLEPVSRACARSAPSAARNCSSETSGASASRLGSSVGAPVMRKSVRQRAVPRQQGHRGAARYERQRDINAGESRTDHQDARRPARTKSGERARRPWIHHDLAVGCLNRPPRPTPERRRAPTTRACRPSGRPVASTTASADKDTSIVAAPCARARPASTRQPRRSRSARRRRRVVPAGSGRTRDAVRSSRPV